MAASKKKKTARARAGTRGRSLGPRTEGTASAKGKAKAKARKASPQAERTPRVGKSRLTPARAKVSAKPRSKLGAKPGTKIRKPGRPGNVGAGAKSQRGSVERGRPARSKPVTKPATRAATKAVATEATAERSSSAEERGGARGVWSMEMGDSSVRDASVQLEENTTPTKPTPRPRTATGETVARGAPPALPTPIATFTI
jgi:hypothetical protein